MIERAPPVPPVSAPKPRRRRFLLFFGIFLSALVALPVTLLVVSDVVMLANGWMAYGQHSDVMQPGLVLGDVFYVDTQAYRGARHPAYGDVVAVEVPGRVIEMSRHPGVRLTERVVGLPGDRVEVRGGIVSINGRALPQEPLGNFRGLPHVREKLVRYRERAPNGVSYEILRAGRPSHDGGPWVVPAGHYFVLADNRDDALDGRFWAAKGWYLPERAILGQAGGIYWSGFDRLDRIGTAVK